MVYNIYMTKEQLSSSPDFDEWFLDTHGGTGRAVWEDDDADEVLFDDYSENEDEQ